MKKLNIQELEEVNGGFNISGTLINSLSSIIKTIHSVGQSLGSSIRRMSTNKLCKV